MSDYLFDGMSLGFKIGIGGQAWLNNNPKTNGAGELLLQAAPLDITDYPQKLPKKMLDALFYWRVTPIQYTLGVVNIPKPATDPSKSIEYDTSFRHVLTASAETGFLYAGVKAIAGITIGGDPTRVNPLLGGGITLINASRLIVPGFFCHYTAEFTPQGPNHMLGCSMEWGEPYYYKK